MKITLSSIIFLILLKMSCYGQTGLFIPELANFDKAMLDLMAKYNVPGGQLTISYQGRLVYNRGFGLANTATGDPVNPNSVFRIASVSKPITAIACMKLFEQGKLGLDAKVFGHDGILNEAIYRNMIDLRDTLITVRMLLQHSGGWDRNLSGDPMFDAYQIATSMGVPSPPSPDVVIQYMLSSKKLDFQPGTQYQYSNFGYCVLGRVIEKITGQTYQDYVLQNILNPLGIRDVRLGYNLLINRLPQEVNYYSYPGSPLALSVYNNSSLVPWPYGGFNLEFMDSHGGWVSSCESLLKLVCAVDGFNTRPDILSGSTISIMTAPSDHNSNYACGFGVNTNNNWWHIGSLPGTTSEIVRNGNRQLNWAILFNTRDQNANLSAEMDNLVWNVLPTITSWPAFDFFSDQTTRIRENSMELEIGVYPNPTSGILNISFASGIQKEIRIRIFNSLRQRISDYKIFNSLPLTSLDLSELGPGVYFLCATDHMQRVCMKKLILYRD